MHDLLLRNLGHDDAGPRAWLGFPSAQRLQFWEPCKRGSRRIRLRDWRRGTGDGVEDSSGNGNDASAPNSAPTYVTGAINGLAAVQFNEANSTYLAFNRPVQDDFTIMFVYQSSQNNQGTGTYYYQGAGRDGEVGGVTEDFGTSLNANGQICAGTGLPDTAIHSGNGFNNGLPHVVTFERTRDGCLGAVCGWHFGGNRGNGGVESLTAPAQLVLGAVTSGGGYFEPVILQRLKSSTRHCPQATGLPKRTS